MKAIKLLSVLLISTAISLGANAQTSKTSSKQTTKTSSTKPAAKSTSAKTDSKGKTTSASKKK